MCEEKMNPFDRKIPMKAMKNNVLFEVRQGGYLVASTYGHREDALEEAIAHANLFSSTHDGNVEVFLIEKRMVYRVQRPFTYER